MCFRKIIAFSRQIRLYTDSEDGPAALAQFAKLRLELRDERR